MQGPHLKTIGDGPLAEFQKEAEAAAARVLELQPGFRYRRQFSGVDCAPPLVSAKRCAPPACQNNVPIGDPLRRSRTGAGSED